MTPSPTETPLESPSIPSKPLEEVKEFVESSTSAIRSTSIPENVAEVEESAAHANGDVRPTEELAPSKAALQPDFLPIVASRSELELPSVPETKPSVPTLVKPELEQKKAATAQSIGKTRDVEKSANPQDAEKVKKRQNALTRTIWTFIMIGGFLGVYATLPSISQILTLATGLLLMGHPYMIVLVFMCQMLVYREVTALFSLKRRPTDEEDARGKDPWSKTLNWYFFAVANYFLYGESIIYYFKVR